MRLLLSACIISALVFLPGGPVKAESVQRLMASEGGSISLQDTVTKLRDDDEGVVVLFAKTKGNYYLRRDLGDFDGVKAVLTKSFKTKKAIRVTADPESLNITDAAD